MKGNEYYVDIDPSVNQESPCAPLLSCTGARREIKSRFRSAISPWIDCRQKLDIIQEKMEERGIALLRRNAFPGFGRFRHAFEHQRRGPPDGGIRDHVSIGMNARLAKR